MIRLFPLLLCILVSLREPSSAAEGHPKPNILFIAVDDLNDWISPLGGHPQTVTPNFERLARSSVLFTNAHCAAPACNASRTALMTGVSPARSGIYQNMQPMREALPDAELLPRYLSRHGYSAAGAGKILHYIIDPISWDDYFPAKEKDNPLPRTLYPENRPVSLPRGGPWQYVETDWAALDASDEEFGGDYLVSDWIGKQLKRDHDKPFFLACGLYRPHEPWFVPKKYFEPFPLETIQLPPGYRADDLDDLPPAAQNLARNRYFAHIQKHDQWKQGIQGYLASIHYADAMLGRVLDALEASPQRDNTIVVLWSDHGWHLGEKQHWQKFTGWRLCTRVPLMVRMPDGTSAGTRCHRAVNLQDLFPTITELTGTPAKPDTDGRSLVPLIKNPEAAWPHHSTTFMQHPDNYAISTDDWRYIHYQNGDEELYQISTDRYEWHNLATDPAHAETLAGLRLLAPKNPAPVFESQAGIADFKATKTLAINHDAAPHSKQSAKKVQLLFLNQREEEMKLIWIDEQGKRHPDGTIKLAAQRLVQTYAGHTWLLLKSDGSELGHIIASDVPARIQIQ